MRVKVCAFASGVLAICAVTLVYFRRKAKKKTLRPHMKLYWFDSYRSKRCEWLLAELGVTHAVEMIGQNPRDTNQDIQADYRDIHPHGTVPCLQIEGRQPIIESAAICMYLADIYDNLGPDLDREAYYNWISYSTSTLDELMEVLFIQWMFTDLKDQDPELINKMVLKFQTFGKYFSKVMEGRDYICGDKLTAADCVLGYNVWWANQMRDGVLLLKFPVIQDYYERLRRRSSFQRVFTETP